MKITLPPGGFIVRVLVHMSGRPFLAVSVLISAVGTCLGSHCWRASWGGMLRITLSLGGLTSAIGAWMRGRCRQVHF